MREREGFNADGRGRGHAITMRQWGKRRNGWENGKWGTGLGAQLRLSNKESHVCHDSFRKRHANFDTSTRSAKGHACSKTQRFKGWCIRSQHGIAWCIQQVQSEAIARSKGEVYCTLTRPSFGQKPCSFCDNTLLNHLILNTSSLVIHLLSVLSLLLHY